MLLCITRSARLVDVACAGSICVYRLAVPGGLVMVLLVPCLRPPCDQHVQRLAFGPMLCYHL